MRVWGVLCFVGCISHLNASIIKVSDEAREEKPGIGAVARIDAQSDKEEKLKESKAELTSHLKENTNNIGAVQEEIKKTEFLLVGEKAVSPPGGGLLLLNPNAANEPIPSYAEIPWWEQWWDGVVSFFFEKNS